MREQEKENILGQNCDKRNKNVCLITSPEYIWKPFCRVADFT